MTRVCHTRCVLCACLQNSLQRFNENYIVHVSPSSAAALVTRGVNKTVLVVNCSKNICQGLASDGVFLLCN